MHAGSYIPPPVERVHTLHAWIVKHVMQRVVEGGLGGSPDTAARAHMHAMLSDAIHAYEQAKCAPAPSLRVRCLLHACNSCRHADLPTRTCGTMFKVVALTTYRKHCNPSSVSLLQNLWRREWRINLSRFRPRTTYTVLGLEGIPVVRCNVRCRITLQVATVLSIQHCAA